MASTQEQGVQLKSFVDEVAKHKADAAKQKAKAEAAEQRVKDLIGELKQAGQENDKAQKELAAAKEHQAALEAAHGRVAQKAADRDNVAADLAKTEAALKKANANAAKLEDVAAGATAENDFLKAKIAATEAHAATSEKLAGKAAPLIAAFQAKANAEAEIQKLI